ncbi:MAG: BON domain-containing protein [Gemmatimonadaceae bacterium]|nr:BON domain-containing protein [Gemmatimonadaceae bacterium]
MSPIRIRDEEPSLGSVLASLAVGALAGFAVGVVVAQKAGGLSGIAARIRNRFGELEDEAEHGRYLGDEGEDYTEDELSEEEEEEYGATGAALEEQVLDAFQEDPVLSERAIDIGAIADGVIELSGWVDTEEEAHHAATVARRVPGVESVVNRLAVGDDEEDDMRDDEDDRDAARRRSEDPSEPRPGGQWEGQRVGTGRRRQGTSDEPDRHADPRPELEDRWLDEAHAEREAAGDIDGVAERRRHGKQARHKEDHTEGGPLAPGGVPKGDHVADPESARDVNPNT